MARHGSSRVQRVTTYANVARDLLKPEAGQSRSAALGALFKSWARYPLEYDATKRLLAVPEIGLPDLMRQLGVSTLELPETPADRHSWNLGGLEQAVLATVVKAIKATSIFEIGTFNGATTAVLADAQASVGKGQVFTLDLPPDRFDETQDPDAFMGSMVGTAFRDLPNAQRITQLHGDSLSFDFSPWRGQIDVVLVDACHDEVHGRSDTLHALALARPGGLIFWDDIAPYWHGLVRGVCEATQGRPLRRILGTTFAVLQV